MSGGGGKGSNTSTVSPPPEVMENYRKVMDRASTLAGTPLTQYQGPMVAPFTPDQQSGFGAVRNAQGSYQPYFNSAMGNLDQATQNLLSGVPQWGGNTVQQYMDPYLEQVFNKVPQFSGAEVSKYMDPYLQNVVESTRANMQQNNARQQQDVIGNAISKGAWGGDRAGIAQAELARLQKLSDDQTIGNLYSQGYGQALNQFNQQQGLQAGLLGQGYQGATGQLNQQQQLQYGANAQQANNRLNAAGQYAGLGNAAFGNNLAGAQALLNSGQMQQQQAQNYLNVPYQQFQAEQQYPWQTTNYLSQLATGVGGQMGQQSSTPSPSMLSQLGGLGLAGYGLFGGGASAGATAAGLAGASAAVNPALAGAMTAGKLFGLFNRGGRVNYMGKQISDGLLNGYADGGVIDIFAPEDQTIDLVQNGGVYDLPENIPDVSSTFVPPPPPVKGVPDRMAPTTQAPQPSPEQAQGMMGMLSKGGADPKMAMIQAGLAMAAGQSPNALTNIAQGGLVGMGALAQQREEARLNRRLEQQESYQNRNLDLAAQKLERDAEQFAQEMGFKEKELGVRERYYQSKGNASPKPKAPTFKTRGDLRARLETDYPGMIDGGDADPKLISAIEAAFMENYRVNGGDVEDAYEQAIEYVTGGQGLKDTGSFGSTEWEAPLDTPGRPSPKTSKKTDSPPMEGARKAPDGNWYVEKDGKYYEVK